MNGNGTFQQVGWCRVVDGRVVIGPCPFPENWTPDGQSPIAGLSEEVARSFGWRPYLAEQVTPGFGITASREEIGNNYVRLLVTAETELPPPVVTPAQLAANEYITLCDQLRAAVGQATTRTAMTYAEARPVLQQYSAVNQSAAMMLSLDMLGAWTSFSESGGTMETCVWTEQQGGAV